jgi:hydroxymethylpyrimidine pyrophosphatase-like HAD family hydrolase
MIWRALACDYDGTLATEDRIGPEALTALEAARRAAVRLILVTGRTFFELIRVCERLDLFDAVVAENGGVLYFPARGVLRDQGPAPPSRLLVELDQRGISFQVGRVIVGVLRDEESRVRDALAAVGGRMEIVYNRGALMLLPPGISKGTGVRQAIQALGVSFHDVLGVGDAENDLDLFEACGWTACPGNGVQELKDRADWVFPGQNGSAMAQAIVGPILGDRLPLARSRRHRVAIGWSTETAEAVTVPERGVNVLVQGDTLSGKSWLAGALVERLAARQYSVCVIDPEGDYRVLAALPNVSWAEVRDEVGWRDALAPMDHDPSACVVLDLSTLDHAERSALIAAGLTLIRERRRRWGAPHWVVLDEAHYWLCHEGVAGEAIGLDDKSFCLVTYRASALREAVWNAIDVFLFGRTTSATELHCLKTVFQDSSIRDVVSILPSVPHGEFLSLETDDERKALTFVAAPRTTWHIRHFRKYADGRLPSHRCFFLRRPDGRLVATVGSLGEFLESLESIDEDVLAFHAARGDFSRWLLEVFADSELGAQLAKIERRWCRREISDLRTALGRSIADAINRAQQRREGDRRGG